MRIVRSLVTAETSSASYVIQSDISRCRRGSGDPRFDLLDRLDLGFDVPRGRRTSRLVSSAWFHVSSFISRSVKSAHPPIIAHPWICGLAVLTAITSAAAFLAVSGWSKVPTMLMPLDLCVFVVRRHPDDLDMNAVLSASSAWLRYCAASRCPAEPGEHVAKGRRTSLVNILRIRPRRFTRQCLPIGEDRR
jgi:hypothetical protein